MNNTINALRAENENLKAENARLAANQGDPDALARANAKIAQLENELDACRASKGAEVSDSDVLVYFDFDSAKLSNEATAALDAIPAGSNVSIKAYASPEGRPDYNKKLSQRRANAVKKYLEGRNVTVSNAEGLGVDGPTSQRLAIVSK